MTPEQAKAAGYCITSRKHREATRIDRADWKEHMASKQPDGIAWVDSMISIRCAADHYRRCYSKDTIVVPAAWIKKLPNSGDGPHEFLALGRTDEPERRGWDARAAVKKL